MKDEYLKQSTLFKNFFKIIKTVLTFNQRQQNPDIYYQETPSYPNLHFSLEKEFGSVVIYRVSGSHQADVQTIK